MTNSTDARAERSRLAMINAGMLLLAENKDATLSDVAAVAGVGRATLYRHFETREQLIEAVARQCLMTFEEATSDIESQATSYLDAIRLLFECVMPLQKELTFIMKVDALVGDLERLAHLFEEQDKEIRLLLKECQKENSISNNVPLDWLMVLLDSFFIAAWRMVNEHNIDHASAAKLAFESFQHGVANRR